MKVLIVVTHLLGTGHLSRALTLARAFRGAKHQVHIASGGMPAPLLDRGDVTLVQLPPVRSDGTDFARLLDSSGALASDAVYDTRTDMLLDQLEKFDPDVIITELFPFGRRILQAEFLTLLKAAQARPRKPLICASIRDILAPPSKPEKAAKTDAIIAEHYDAVLVHADPAVTPLEVSWPVSTALAPKLHYTGFVAPPPAGPHPDGLGAGEIIVSAGGGNVGDALFETGLQAGHLSGHRWRLLVGGQDAANRIAALQKRAPENMHIEAARPEFRQMLYQAAASVSMCGYNTALDLLQSGCRAVLVPFDAGSEVEQTLRGQALCALDGIAVLRTADLTGERLLSRLDDVLKAPKRARQSNGLQGAAETVRIVANLREATR